MKVPLQKHVDKMDAAVEKNWGFLQNRQQKQVDNGKEKSEDEKQVDKDKDKSEDLSDSEDSGCWINLADEKRKLEDWGNFLFGDYDDQRMWAKHELIANQMLHIARGSLLKC